MQSIEARCQDENEDVVGAAPTGDAPTISEWSTRLLPVKVHHILRGLTVIHWGQVMHIVACCHFSVKPLTGGNLSVNSLRPSDAYMLQQTNRHWFRQWLVAWSAPSHYLNQCWDIAHWTHRNKLQWNFYQNSYIFIQENPFENGVWKMASILSRHQCVKPTETIQKWPKTQYFILT